MAQQSARRGRKTRAIHCALSTLWVIWIRSANSHTGPQPLVLHQRPDRWQHPTTPTFKKPLASYGASTDGLRQQYATTAEVFHAVPDANEAAHGYGLDPEPVRNTDYGDGNIVEQELAGRRGGRGPVKIQHQRLEQRVLAQQRDAGLALRNQLECGQQALTLALLAPAWRFKGRRGSILFEQHEFSSLSEWTSP